MTFIEQNYYRDFEGDVYMIEFVTNFNIGIIAGLLSGLISGFILYMHTTKYEKYRNILNYCERTVDKYDEMVLLLQDENITYLKLSQVKKICDRKVHRGFWGYIVDGSQESKELQEAIASCNGIINEIGEFIDAKNTHGLKTLIQFDERIPNVSIDLNNSIINYSYLRYKKFSRSHNYIKIFGFATIFIVFISVMIIILYKLIATILPKILIFLTIS